MTTNTDIIPYQKQGEVIKHNSFIRCNNNLTTAQRKSFAIMLKETIDIIKEEGEKDFYTMPLVEYRRIMGYMPDIPTKQIRDDLKELQTKLIEWNLDGNGYGVSAVMLASFELEKGTGRLEWEFSKKLLNKLTADGYTPLKLSVILDFNSKYSLALYENIQMRKSFNKTEFNLKEFRALMGVEEGEHLRMGNFKTFVLHAAIAEINAKSDLKVTYEDKKIGAKITGFVFKWDNLTIEQIKERNEKKEKIEKHQKALKPNFGMKFKIGGKWHTLTKDGFINRGKILGGFDIVDSYAQYVILEKQGFVTEKKGTTTTTTFLDKDTQNDTI